jgi:hypothetical protein
MPVIQHFSVPAGDSCTINFDVDPNDSVTLDNTEIIWEVFAQIHGIPDFEVDPVLTKTLNHGIEVTDSGHLRFAVTLERADTLALLRNYYHEAKLIDQDNNHVTVTYGIMTVTQTEIRE